MERLERLKLENELLLTKSKAQMINLYLDELNNSMKQQEIIDRLKELNLTISDSDYIYSQDEITSKNLELLQILEDKEV